MIVEQKRLFGIFAIGQEKEIKPGTFTPLGRNLLTGKPTESFHVLNAGVVSFNTKIGGNRMTLQSRDPEQINKFNIRTKFPYLIVQRVYRYVPSG